MDATLPHPLASNLAQMKLQTPERSEADGMECRHASTERTYSQTDKIPSCAASPDSGSVGKVALQVHRSTVKRKEPKFIPHEPYKAAVAPIFGNGKLKCENRPGKSLTHGLYLCGAGSKGTADDSEKTTLKQEPQPSCKCVESKNILEEEVSSLKLEKATLEAQLKIQTQVNQDLKKMLVASLGEDLQTKVQFLTEDKTKLAHDIVHYSQKLMEDSEHLEKLSIQCDVWRSKFLASSLMVDELAGWKAVLNHHLDEALNVIKILFGELEKISSHCTKALCFANSIREKCGIGHPEQTGSADSTANTLEVAVEMVNVVQKLHDKLCGPGVALAAASSKHQILHNINMTPGQQLGYQVLTNCLSHELSFPDCGMAPECHSCTISHLYKGVIPRFHPSARYEHLTFNCCYHCRGDIQLM